MIVGVLEGCVSSFNINAWPMCSRAESLSFLRVIYKNRCFQKKASEHDELDQIITAGSGGRGYLHLPRLQGGENQCIAEGSNTACD